MLDEMPDISAKIRITPVNPFDIVYTYDKEKDLVILHALVHQKAAW